MTEETNDKIPGGKNELYQIVAAILQAKGHKTMDDSADRIVIGVESRDPRTPDKEGDRFLLAFKFGEMVDRGACSLAIRGVVGDGPLKIKAAQRAAIFSKIWQMNSISTMVGAFTMDPDDGEMIYYIRLSPNALTASPDSALAEVDGAITHGIAAFSAFWARLKLPGMIGDLNDLLAMLMKNSDNDNNNDKENDNAQEA